MCTIPEDTDTKLAEVIFPEQTNHHGTLFAGTAFSLMGKAAIVAASRVARRLVVMAASDHVDFLRPVKVGQILECTAQVESIGRTSMVVLVEAFSEDLTSIERSLAIRGRFVMVAVDEDGHPVPVYPQRPS